MAPMGWIRAHSARLIVLAAVALVAVVRLSASSGPAAATTGYATALQACQGPASTEKAEATLSFDWHLAVEEDRAEASALVLVSGDDQLMCLSWRNADGTFGFTETGLGRVAATATAALTYDTGTSPDENASPPIVQLVIGRVPDGTARVEVSAADGSVQQATLGGGRYLAWLSSAAQPTRIAAYGASSVMLAELADPNGLQPTQ